MLPQWIIEKKRDGRPLSDEELSDFIAGYAKGDIPDYQMSALAMAIVFRGMSNEEVLALTRAMMESGTVLDMSRISLPRIDKHSTGGIGDKISLILAPLVACCGLAVPMIAGRGLGITGGTLDKLESIPGYNTRLSEEQFMGVVDTCGCSITGQTESLVPADRKLYALRDVTGTVPSIPLIVASILSKKLAANLNGLVMDVKCGSGAFMKDIVDARELAATLAEVGTAMGTPTSAMITDMEQPLGRTAGNALEVVESVDVLRGSGPEDVLELTLALGARMLIKGGVCDSVPASISTMKGKIENGEAYRRFGDMVAGHGGDRAAADNPVCLLTASQEVEVAAPSAGWISRVDAEAIGRACLTLGAGRTQVTDSIDHSVGISDMKKVGELVDEGEPLARVHMNEADSDAAVSLVGKAFAIEDAEPAHRSLILEEI